MPSVGRWVLTHTELEAAVHGTLFQFQLNGFSFRDCSVIVGVLAGEPGMELLIPVIDKL